MSFCVEVASCPLDDSLHDNCENLTVLNAENSSLASTTTAASSFLEPGLLNETGECMSHHTERKRKEEPHLNPNPFSFLHPSNFVNISRGSQREKILKPITIDELRRHNDMEKGVWIVCGTSVYDVTHYIDHHPGGIKSILRRSGGVDCTRDMKFHSPKAIKLWKSMKIGYLVLSDRHEGNKKNQNLTNKKYRIDKCSGENNSTINELKSTPMRTILNIIETIMK